MGARHTPDPLRPIWIDLYQAIEAHIDAADRVEFLDTVTTIADQHDRHRGTGAGDAYLARVINSLTGTGDDGDPPT